MDVSIRKTGLFNRIAPLVIGVDNAAGVIASSIEAGGPKLLEISFDTACFISRPGLADDVVVLPPVHIMVLKQAFFCIVGYSDINLVPGNTSIFEEGGNTSNDLLSFHDALHDLSDQPTSHHA